MEKPVVVFVRHKFAPDIVRCLWDRQQIALQYQNIPSATPDDYEKKTAYEAIKRLRGFCEQGVIVAASYRAYEPAKLLIGTIGPGDPDKLIRIENLKGYFNKIVQIENAIEVQYSDYPILTVQPTGGTISQWPIAADSVRAIYAGEPLKGVHDLAPGQLEVLCYRECVSAPGFIHGGVDALPLCSSTLYNGSMANRTPHRTNKSVAYDCQNIDERACDGTAAHLQVPALSLR